MRKLKQGGHRIEAIGIDSWGVDFAVLNEEDELIGNPYHYRDAQTSGTLEQAGRIFGKRGLFRETGVQDMWYNTIYQILGIQNRNEEYFKRAQCILMIPDILGYFLTGNKQMEYTSASTTQIYDLRKKKWSENILYGGPGGEDISGSSDDRSRQGISDRDDEEADRNDRGRLSQADCDGRP